MLDSHHESLILNLTPYFKLLLYVCMQIRQKNKHSLPLEPQHGVGLQIADVQLATLGNDFRVLPAQQPADVREEEPTGCVVRIGIRFRIFMVHPMVASPVHGTVLECNGVEHDQNDPQWQLGFVRSMGPQAVGTGRDSQPGHDVEYECYGRKRVRRR